MPSKFVPLGERMTCKPGLMVARIPKQLLYENVREQGVARYFCEPVSSRDVVTGESQLAQPDETTTQDDSTVACSMNHVDGAPIELSPSAL